MHMSGSHTTPLPCMHVHVHYTPCSCSNRQSIPLQQTSKPQGVSDVSPSRQSVSALSFGRHSTTRALQRAALFMKQARSNSCVPAKMWLKPHRKRSSGSGGNTCVVLAILLSTSKILSVPLGLYLECSSRSTEAKCTCHGHGEEGRHHHQQNSLVVCMIKLQNPSCTYSSGTARERGGPAQQTFT